MIDEIKLAEWETQDAGDGSDFTLSHDEFEEMIDTLESLWKQNAELKAALAARERLHEGMLAQLTQWQAHCGRLLAALEDKP